MDEPLTELTVAVEALTVVAVAVVAAEGEALKGKMSVKRPCC
jgi:hypothetical protein